MPQVLLWEVSRGVVFEGTPFFGGFDGKPRGKMCYFFLSFFLASFLPSFLPFFLSFFLSFWGGGGGPRKTLPHRFQQFVAQTELQESQKGLS